MTARTVTTQAELDRALADLAVTEVTIDAPRTELITLTDTGDKYVEITGETRVGSMGGTSRVGTMYGTSSVGSMYGTSSVGTMGGTSSVGSMGGTSSVGSMYGTSSVGTMGGTSRVGTMGGTSRVDSMYGTSRVVARGFASVHAHGGTIEAGDHVAVFRHDTSARITGGHVIDCTVPNVELLERTMQQIEQHPETWDQSSWVTKTDCGTAYCFAGWAAVLAGAGEVTDENARSIAESELLLTGQVADRLFSGGNTMSYLRSIVDELTAAAAQS